ncbi:MAG: anti-sigma factor [Polyangiaceae bacterium]
MNCRRVLPLLDAFADGELAPDQVLTVEQHLVDCERCGELLRLDHAVRVSTQRVARADVTVSAAFEARIREALAAERSAEQAPDVAPQPMSQLSWRSIAPLALAATVALYFAAARSKSPDALSAVAAQSAAQASLSPNAGSSMTSNVEQLIDELVTHHTQEEKPSVTEPTLLRRLEPEVGVPVSAPSLYGARWEGASVVPVHAVRDQRAASLRYNLGGHRVTLYVYNSARVPLRVTLEPRVVYNTPVYVGSRRGYSIAAVERRGVGYAVATDLNDRESAELVVASLH